MSIINRMLFLSIAFMSGLSFAAETSLKLPPIMFFSTLDESLYKTIKSKALFSQVDKELYGSPLELGVFHTFAPTAGGTAAGLTSAVFAGGTLGLLPIVSNNDLVVTYILRSHGKELASFKYSQNFTQAINIYSNQGVNKLDKSTMEWVNSTVDLFVAEVEKNQAVRKLVDEYIFYFGAIN